MLKKRFSTTLLALVVTVAIPGSAFAADVVSESTGEVSAPPSVSAPADSTNEADNAGSTGAVGETPAEAAVPTGEQPTAEQSAVETPVAEQPTEVVVTPETPAVETPVEQPVVEAPPAEEVIVPETPAVEPEVIPEVLPPVEEVVTVPAIVLEEVVTAPAIVVEPVAATLTITHRLIVGEQYEDKLEVIEGLVVGQEIDLTQYFAPVDWVECITQEISINLDSAEDTIILEYIVKTDADVDVNIEQDRGVVDQDINEELQPE